LGLCDFEGGSKEDGSEQDDDSEEDDSEEKESKVEVSLCVLEDPHSLPLGLVEEGGGPQNHNRHDQNHKVEARGLVETAVPGGGTIFVKYQQQQQQQQQQHREKEEESNRRNTDDIMEVGRQHNYHRHTRKSGPLSSAALSPALLSYLSSSKSPASSASSSPRTLALKDEPRLASPPLPLSRLSLQLEMFDRLGSSHSRPRPKKVSFKAAHYPCYVMSLTTLRRFTRIPSHEDALRREELCILTESSTTPTSSHTYFVSRS
jgi:hypothetical protein